jgi:hypothetical protein
VGILGSRGLLSAEATAADAAQAGGGLHAKSDYPPDVFRKTADQVADDFVALAKAERWGVIGEMGTGTTVRTARI